MVTRVFVVEIAKPINCGWREFYEVMSKAMYLSAQIANEAMLVKYLLARKQLPRDESTFCSLMTSCKSQDAGFSVKCAACHQACLKFSKFAKQLLRCDVAFPAFKNNRIHLKSNGLKLFRADGGQLAAELRVLSESGRGKKPKHPQVLLKTKGMERRQPERFSLLEEIVDGKYKVGESQIRKDKIRKKTYLSISYSYEPNAVSELSAINSSRVMGVDLGVRTPAYCAFNDSLKRKSFYVEGDRLLSVKKQIVARRRGISQAIDKGDVRRGHGKASRSRPLRAIGQKWVNFRRTWNHVLSRRIIEYAIENQVGAIGLEKLSPSELISFIKYKAEEHGIRVIEVNPRGTSQTCSECGLHAEGFSFTERVRNKFPDFVCPSCGFSGDADYNAARNIAQLCVDGLAPSALSREVPVMSR